MASSNEKTQTSARSPRPQSRPHRTEQKRSGGGTGLAIGVIAAILLALAAGVYSWLGLAEQKKEADALRTKVKFLENRVDYTESAIVKITSGEEIVPANPAIDGNLVINEEQNTQAAGAADKKHKTPSATHQAARGTNPRKGTAGSQATPVRKKKAVRRAHTATADMRTSSGGAPETFGDTYTPPTTVHYAVLIDSFSERRQAKITQALFAMRYGAYIRKLGTNYNVYAGWYTNMNDARAKLHLLEEEYGPSCRIVTLYN